MKKCGLCKDPEMEFEDFLQHLMVIHQVDMIKDLYSLVERLELKE